MRCCHFISHYTAELLPPNSILWGCVAAAASNSTTLKGYTTSNTTTPNPKILQGCAAASQLLHTIFQRCAATAVSPLHNIKRMSCCLLLLLWLRLLLLWLRLLLLLLLLMPLLLMPLLWLLHFSINNQIQ